MKKVSIISLLFTVLLLTACQQNKEINSTASSTKITQETTANSTAAVKKEVETSTSFVSTESSNQQMTMESSSSSIKESQVVNILWNEAKAQQLNTFMASWGQTMKQSYKEYGPGNNVNLYGLQLPDTVLANTNGWQATVNNVPITLTWSENGEANAGYALVAVYSDVETQASLAKHVYFFTIDAGVPKVLVTSQNQGNPDNYLYFKETENQQLKDGFTEIVGNV
ncbi:DUF4767 domain-containing protein [Enterococcus thailandicus]|uniref:Uncharacterized protein n=2 Tax=root TaxID=1 RepID=A0A1L8XLN8_ENTTH|nr:DUF4767 domain-containing protein [Enterococcus thailandicus]ASZ08287.1 DUF4767 domain-containing protein [Enterococcus thailandicus]MDK4353140.1 DUF4767 domain-containing protein [Enterococcus thailandicus]MDT2735280.1 DUF4767 domain-containing protein [Enterococcus thailandicus]MEA4828513.1 DUF4767 domain-containing protein [Enterococcus thailandicus]OJG94125.1 hypothetical protein RV17_GL000777 [Enterococcus thailandicus]